VYGEYGEEVPLLDQLFGHLHEVEGNLDTGGYGGFGDAAGDESHAGVEAFEFGAVVDEAKLHFVEAGRSALRFGGGHELRAQAFALTGRFNRNQAEMGTLPAGLDEDAGRESPLLFAQQKFSSSPHFMHGGGIYALTFDVGAFGYEGPVDEADDGADVGEFG
jgi:hypothetical protein